MKKRVFAVVMAAALAVTALSACSGGDKTKEASEGTAKEGNTGEDKAAGDKAAGETSEREMIPATTKVVLNEVAHSIFYAPMYAAVQISVSWVLRHRSIPTMRALTIMW